MYNKSEQFKLKKNIDIQKHAGKVLYLSVIYYIRQATSMVTMIVSQFDNWCWKKNSDSRAPLGCNTAAS